MMFSFFKPTTPIPELLSRGNMCIEKNLEKWEANCILLRTP
uniref:Uncharacterized protein n=1 Tax=Arundo donax TaxID=35708 RepID=A0A0A8YDY9_ARUDO